MGRKLILGLCLVLNGCIAATGSTGGEDHPGTNGVTLDDIAAQEADKADSVGSVGAYACSTTGLAALSSQIVGEMNCLLPGRFERIDNIPGVILDDAARAVPYAHRDLAAKLRAIMAHANGDTMTINSALRTIPQQLLLYKWYTAGRCGVALAALPDRSNHLAGLALDLPVPEVSAWRGTLEANGFHWFGSADKVHYDYTLSSDSDDGIKYYAVLAFQRLWNRNHPEDKIREDGDYGNATELRMRKAPAEGFATGAVCGP